MSNECGLARSGPGVQAWPGMALASLQAGAGSGGIIMLRIIYGDSFSFFGTAQELIAQILVQQPTSGSTSVNADQTRVTWDYGFSTNFTLSGDGSNLAASGIALTGGHINRLDVFDNFQDIDGITVRHVNRDATTLQQAIDDAHAETGPQYFETAFFILRAVTIIGGDGNDILEGGNKTDTVNGGAGNDKIMITPGDDVVRGGDGIDMADFSGLANVDPLSCDLALKTAAIPGILSQSIVGIEDLVLTDLSDIAAGNFKDNLIFAGAGNDSVSGKGGNDTILGQDGADTLEGNDGNDVIRGQGGNDFIKGNGGDDDLIGDDGLFGEVAGTDVIRGGPGNDTISGGDRSDTLLGNNGNDSIDGDRGPDRLLGNGGDDTLNGGQGSDTMFGHGGADRLLGGSGGDSIIGFNGKDTVLGGGGEDTVFGGDGNDIVKGQGGSDALYAGFGNDRLTGGSGFDTFVFGLSDGGSDTITDMTTEDEIRFPGKKLGDVVMEMAGSGTDISYEGGTVHLDGIALGVVEATQDGADVLIII